MFRLLAKPLTRAEQEQIISEKLAWILRACQPTKILLFGSAARFEMSEASDIDLALIFPNGHDLRAAKNSVFKARPKDDWPHDLLFYTENEFAESVAKGGGAAFLAAEEGVILFNQKDAT